MGVLSHIVVVDRTTTLSGAIAGLQLVDAGASVYRMVRPGDDVSGEHAIRHFMLHRGKQIIEIERETVAGRQTLLDAILQADILLEDDGRCAHDRVSPEFDYDDLRAQNPGLVYCRIQNWWPDSESPRWLTELEIQALTGQMSFMGRLNEEPARAGADVVAYAGALHAFIGISAAIYVREMTGRGQRVDVSVLTAVLAIASHWIVDFSRPDAFIGGNTSPYAGPEAGYQCADGRVIFGFFGLRGDRKEPWHKLCAALGLEALLEDPFMREHGYGIIGGGKDALFWKPIVEESTKNFSREEMIKIIEDVGGAGVPIMQYGDLYGEELHPQIEAVRAVIDVPGRGRAIVSPWIHDLGDVDEVRKDSTPAKGGAALFGSPPAEKS